MSAQRHELHLLTGSYALDALTGDEQADFEEHLDRCPACAEEVRGLRETAARLAASLRAWPMLVFEVTEHGTSASDGERLAYVPGRGFRQSLPRVFAE